ncbi:MAG TPA: hypothetical protein VNB90_02140 [Cytophagaceae bacterium]|jgi:hypothetical protein|nr:hypothetical protein [Cytophagaceae bacterium]
MKKLIIFTICAGILAGCAKPYQLTDYEKGAQKGFHANQANEIIDKNEKNRALNKKAAEKAKKQQNDQLNALNNRNKAAKGQLNTRVFKFY